MSPEADLILNVAKVFGLSAVAFFFALALTPLLTHYLYRYRLWRKAARTRAPDGASTPIFASLHKEREVSTPRMGGLLIWLTLLIVIFGFWAAAKLTASPLVDKINFLSRNQTWLPLFTLVSASLLGLIDDLLQVFGRGSYIAGGLKFRVRLAVVFLIALAGAYWFYFRLEQSTLYVPGAGDVALGLWFIPLFIITMFATFSTGVIDGLDGLSGGVFATIFAAYGGIAFFRGQIDLAAFSAVLLGALLAFLWFNIPPARFYMGETGILGHRAPHYRFRAGGGGGISHHPALVQALARPEGVPRRTAPPPLRSHRLAVLQGDDAVLGHERRLCNSRDGCCACRKVTYSLQEGPTAQRKIPSRPRLKPGRAVFFLNGFAILELDFNLIT